MGKDARPFCQSIFAWSNPIKPEKFYDIFNHAPTAIIPSQYSKNDSLLPLFALFSAIVQVDIKLITFIHYIYFIWLWKPTVRYSRHWWHVLHGQYVKNFIRSVITYWKL